MLQDKVIGIYCIVDDILKEMNHKEHRNRKFSDSQVLSTALVSAMLFNGNQNKALSYMKSHMCKTMINKSGFTKRLHRLNPHYS
nr:hypothetical protein [Flavivirga aquatica]